MMSTQTFSHPVPVDQAGPASAVAARGPARYAARRRNRAKGEVRAGCDAARQARADVRSTHYVSPIDSIAPIVRHRGGAGVIGSRGMTSTVEGAPGIAEVAIPTPIAANFA